MAIKIWTCLNKKVSDKIWLLVKPWNRYFQLTDTLSGNVFSAPAILNIPCSLGFHVIMRCKLAKVSKLDTYTVDVECNETDLGEQNMFSQ